MSHEPYQHLSSKLEPHRADIAEMRRLNWPYRKIRDWLAEEKGIAVRHTSVDRFCKVREIKKGRGETRAAPVVYQPRTSPSAKAQTREVQEKVAHTQARLDGDDFDFGA